MTSSLASFPNVNFMNLDGLSLAYRGSETPQRVDVRVETKSRALNTQARLSMRYLVDAIQLGAAGSDVFAPSSGRCQLVKGSFAPGDADAKGPRFAWTLELAGVAPQFLRVMVEHLSMAGGSAAVPVEALTITSGLEPTDDSLSLGADELRSWLTDPDAYPGAWPELGFELAHTSVPRGATVQIQLASAPTAEVEEKLRYLLAVWGIATTTYPNAAKAAGHASVIAPMAKISRKKLDVSARWDPFDRHAKLALAMLTNMLVRFHHDVAELVRVEYGVAGSD